MTRDQLATYEAAFLGAIALAKEHAKGRRECFGPREDDMGIGVDWSAVDREVKMHLLEVRCEALEKIVAGY